MMSRDIIQFSFLGKKIVLSFVNNRETRVMCNSVSLSRVCAWGFDTLLHVFVLKPQVCDFIPTAIVHGNYLRGVLDANGYIFKTRLIGYVMIAKDI